MIILLSSFSGYVRRQWLHERHQLPGAASTQYLSTSVPQPPRPPLPAERRHVSRLPRLPKLRLLRSVFRSIFWSVIWPRVRNICGYCLYYGNWFKKRLKQTQKAQTRKNIIHSLKHKTDKKKYKQNNQATRLTNPSNRQKTGTEQANTPAKLRGLLSLKLTMPVNWITEVSMSVIFN